MLGALDIGGTKLLAAVAGAGGALLRMERRATPEADPLAALVALLDAARDGEPLDGIAVAAPGPFDRAAGALADPPNLARAWWGLDLAGGLRRHFGCPVLVENDANCAGVAEARTGAAAGLRTVVYITVSTGIGSGVIRDGRPLIGRHDSEGGHQVLWPAHLGGPPCHCGGAGCLETLASGLAIERRFGRRAEDLDDPGAWEDVGRWLGLGVANAIALVDPDAVVLGGGVCRSAERFWPSLAATVAAAVRMQPVPPVRLAALGEERNLLGALALAGDAAAG